MPPRIPATPGQRFGHVVVVGEGGFDRHQQVLWRLRCDCGRSFSSKSRLVRGGEVTTCGRRKYCRRYTRLRRSHERFDPAKRWALGALKRTRQRARASGIEWKLDVDDLLPVPTRCPLLGIELRVGRRGFHPSSPAIDRIDNRQGYVRGNVWIISNRANLIKRDASLQELEMIAAGLRRQQQQVERAA